MTGNDIKAERNRLGVAQSTLAKARGWDNSVLSAVENGDPEVTPGELVGLWNLLQTMKPAEQAQAEAAA